MKKYFLNGHYIANLHIYLSCDPQILISRICSKKWKFTSIDEISHKLFIKPFTFVIAKDFTQIHIVQ